MTIHTVAPGDTIYTIARRYGVTPERIISDNMLTDPNRLAVGQTLVILYYDRIHIVEAGETVSSIAAEYDTSVRALLRNNPQLRGDTTVYEGQPLVISYSGIKRGALETNGYAYPFIDRDILRMTLPYLTYLTIFTYGFRPDGSLIIPDDEPVIALAKEYGTASVLLLSTLTDEGKFSSALAVTILTDYDAQSALIANLLAVMREKGYYGLDVDFEYVPPEQRDAYTEFIARVTEAANAEGFTVGVALAPKTSASQSGLLYESHDYPALGAAADSVLLMTYEWGYTYSEPMAVAPIDKVRRVVDYAVTGIAPDKIFLGMPNYGYDWTLPYVEGETKARSLGNTAAVDLAVEHGAEIKFDGQAMTPYFNYTADGKAHEVWFEDARSVEAKLLLATEKRLRGVSIWNIMRYFPQLWLVANGGWEIKDANI